MDNRKTSGNADTSAMTRSRAVRKSGRTIRRAACGSSPRNGRPVAAQFTVPAERRNAHYVLGYN